MIAAFALSLALSFGFAVSGVGSEQPDATAVEVTVAATGAADALAKVDVFEVSGLIDNVVANGIERAVERSATNGAQALVLQVNSRGAVVDQQRMAQLLQVVRDSAVPVGVWVGPSGSRALGWSSWLLAVADVSAMAPNSTVGKTGTPISLDGKPLSFGEATSLLRSNTLGTDDARDRGVLRLDIADEGVPVLRNMLFALDGLSVDGKVLDTVVEVVGDDGTIVREAATTRFFKLGTFEQLMHTSASAALEIGRAHV